MQSGHTNEEEKGKEMMESGRREDIKEKVYPFVFRRRTLRHASWRTEAQEQKEHKNGE